MSLYGCSDIAGVFLETPVQVRDLWDHCQQVGLLSCLSHRRDKDKIGKVQPFLKPRTVVGVPGTVWDYDVMPTLYLFH